MTYLEHRITLIILTLILFSLKLFANDPSQELSGTIIYYDQRNNTTDPYSSAFDGKTDTFFKSDGTFGNWIGYDLGTSHVITGVGYYPRIINESVEKQTEYSSRLQLGIFEGANSPDFGDAVALAIIPTTPIAGLNSLTINCSRGFRYVRFVFPYAQQSGKSNYMAELKFYGYKGLGDNTQLPQLTNLPTVSIHTVDKQDITSKDIFINGIVSIVYENGTKFFTDSLQIRGRGNNSWSHPKKPYRMKLYNSVKLMGLPAKAKNWTLINNYGDKTLMRNILAFDFARRLEMPYTSPAEAVDVVLNGDYKGCYQLCDHIDVRKNRIDVEEMELTDLTGGYHIEIDAYARNEAKWFTSSAYSIPVTIKYPDEDDITPQQEAYIAAHFNKLANSVQAANYKDPVNGFRKYLELESFLRHFLVGEYTGNTDTYWSVRMSKRKDDDKFFLSPVWDFDLGFENDHRTYSITEHANIDNQWVSLTNRTSAAGGTKNMLSRIIGDEGVQSKLEDIYSHYRNSGVISKEILLGVIDSCETLLADAQALNFKRWNIMLTKVHENPVIYGSYAAEVANVYNYVGHRIDWMDQKLSYVPSSLRSSLEDLGITVRSTKNILRISNLPENSSVRIVNMLGAICSIERNVSELSVPLTSGIYIINVTIDGNTYNAKCIVR